MILCTVHELNGMRVQAVGAESDGEEGREGREDAMWCCAGLIDESFV